MSQNTILQVKTPNGKTVSVVRTESEEVATEYSIRCDSEETEAYSVAQWREDTWTHACREFVRVCRENQT